VEGLERLSGRPVLVTGAYGLVGSWLVPALLAARARVVVLRRDRARRSSLVLTGAEAACDVVYGDLLDRGLVERVVGEYGVRTVFHLAAQTIVGTANRWPVPTFEANVRGTWILLEACRLGGVSEVVVAASDKAYGDQAELPYREDATLRPRHPYDASKAAADLIARSYHHTYGLPVATTRLANVYGGGDPNLSRLVPEAVLAVIAGRPPIVRSDGSPERDFLYVEDAVAAYLAIWHALADGRAGGEAFNAGSGVPRAVGDVVALVCRVAGADLVPDVRGTGVPPGEIARQYVDASKLRALTGWEPRVSLEDGVRRTLAWYREHAAALGA
jgi:CDP-glucose 4,6-dehydratase